MLVIWTSPVDELSNATKVWTDPERQSIQIKSPAKNLLGSGSKLIAFVSQDGFTLNLNQKVVKLICDETAKGCQRCPTDPKGVGEDRDGFGAPLPLQRLPVAELPQTLAKHVDDELRRRQSVDDVKLGRVRAGVVQEVSALCWEDLGDPRVEQLHRDVLGSRSAFRGSGGAVQWSRVTRVWSQRRLLPLLLHRDRVMQERVSLRLLVRFVREAVREVRHGVRLLRGQRAVPARMLEPRRSRRVCGSALLVCG